MPRPHERLDAAVGICNPRARMERWETGSSLEDARDPISDKVESEHSLLRATLWLTYT